MLCIFVMPKTLKNNKFIFGVLKNSLVFGTQEICEFPCVPKNGSFLSKFSFSSTKKKIKKWQKNILRKSQN